MPLTKQQEARIKQLEDFGLKYNGAEFTLKNEVGYFDVHWTEISFAGDEEWDTIINSIKVPLEKNPN